MVFKDPLDNVPTQVRVGAGDTLKRSLNVRQRRKKKGRFAFSDSKDALVWTVFAYLLRHVPAALPYWISNRLNLQVAGEPEALLWGVPLGQRGNGERTRDTLTDVLQRFGEDPEDFTEPDVMLDFGAHGLIFIEATFGAPTATITDQDLAPYLAANSSSGMTPLAKSESNGLMRSWCIGKRMAGDRPFRLVALLDRTPNVFHKLSSLDVVEWVGWRQFLDDVGKGVGGWPTWMVEWLVQRDLVAPGNVRDRYER